MTAVRLAIGIPTRNRADLAMAAVESAALSAPPGVAVVVSDNSTDPDERRRLEEFCARRPAGTEYVRPPEPLEMPAHWEWLWHVIRERIAPTHVTYLTDRLVFAASALGELMDVVTREPRHVVSYHWDHVSDATTPVELVQSQWTGQLLELDAPKLIELSSRGAFGNYMPRLMNCIAPTGTLEAIAARFGDVFGPTSPDYRFAYRCLAICDTMLYLDRSCLIEHGLGSSAGNSYLRGRPNEAARDFARSLSVPRFGNTPEPAFETGANTIFEEYCAVRAESDGDRFPPLERDSYLSAHAISIDRIAEPEWRARMQAVLRRHGWNRRRRLRRVLGLATEMASYFIRHPGALARSAKRQLWDRPPGTPAAFLLPRAGLSARVRDDLRFGSSEEAIAYANAHPRPRMPYAWHVHRLERAGAVVRRWPWS